MGLALLLLQLGLPSVVSALEIMRDSDGAGSVVHIESEGSEDCGLHHDHHFCQVVRTLAEGQRRAAPPLVGILRWSPVSSPRPAPVLQEHRSPWLQDRHSSRAPPAV